MSAEYRSSVAAALGRGLAIIALVALCLALLFGTELLVREGRPSPDYRSDAMLQLHGESVHAWLAVLALSIGLFLVFGLWKALRLLYSWTFGPASPFGKTVTARLVGLAVAVVLLPRGVQWLLVTPLLLFAELVRALPERLATLLQRSRGRNGTVTLEEGFGRLFELIQILASELARLVSRWIDGSVLSDAVLALMVWVLVSRLIDRTPSESGFRAWFVRLDDAQRRLAILAAVFLVGIYFSMASIVAIPYLQDERQPANLTRESLEKTLESFKSKPAELEALLPPSLLNFVPLQAVGAAIVARNAEPAAPAASSPPSDLSTPAAATAASAASAALVGAAGVTGFAPATLRQVEDLIGFVRQRRDEAKARAIALREGVTARQTQLATGAAVSFETEMRQQLSSQERFTFYRQLQNFSQQAMTNQLRALEDCKRDLDSADRQVDGVGRLLLYSLPDATDSFRSAQLYSAFDAISSAAASYGRACVDRPFERGQIAAPEAGTGWGPFGWIANWLLRTRSLALTLITGMLGFGLLGAAISSFVRADPLRAGDPRGLVGHVVIRGVSAAVVVFLAVKGGLAIFATGSSEPNAYVLFFTCLVGAVFSEDVWTWARARFKEKFLNSGAPRKDVPRRLRAAAQPALTPKGTSAKQK